MNSRGADASRTTGRSPGRSPTFLVMILQASSSACMALERRRSTQSRRALTAQRAQLLELVKPQRSRICPSSLGLAAFSSCKPLSHGRAGETVSRVALMKFAAGLSAAQKQASTWARSAPTLRLSRSSIALPRSRPPTRSLPPSAPGAGALDPVGSAAAPSAHKRAAAREAAQRHGRRFYLRAVHPRCAISVCSRSSPHPSTCALVPVK